MTKWFKKSLYVLVLLVVYSCGTETKPATYQLTTQVSPTGAGTVQPDSGEYEEGESVELRATASEGFTFARWEGGIIDRTKNPVVLVMDKDYSVRAVFDRKQYELTVVIEGADGQVTERIVEAPKSQYDFQTLVELTAVEDERVYFTGWGGDLSGTENPVTLLMDEPRQVIAYFEGYPPSVTTKRVHSVTSTRAVVEAVVDSAGYSSVRKRGVCYATEASPTLQDSCTEIGVGLGEFRSEVTGLKAGTQYYVRAYATNSAGTGYGEQESFTTLDGSDNATVVEVTSPTGRIWMDRNLGASRAATSSTDAESYGDLYQWGRAADGHQVRTSPTTTTLSSTDQPGHGEFILAPDDPYDWRSPQNDNLWQGVNGTNNPCPSGYRLPTVAEWDDERQSWSSNDLNGAYASPLKLPVAGLRYDSSGSLDFVGSRGYYWSGSVDGTYSRFLNFNSSDAYMGRYYRTNGYSVRCLKDTSVTLAALSTTTITDITPNSAQGGGEITDDGGAEITARGVVWSTSENPTLDANDGFTEDGSGTGAFDSDLTGLSPDTQYYVRAYATNSVGTQYGQQENFTTGDGRDNTTVVEVTSPTGRVWMDRNLGALRAAESSTDEQAYGDLYQWGRAADGHQVRTSPTTTTLSSTDQPGHGEFILAPDSPYDWRSPQNDNLWQGVNGVNNPCPDGYRVPTSAEWESEIESWSSNNAVGAFGSPLRWAMGGGRWYSNGTIFNEGSFGHYWTSTVNGIFILRINFSDSESFGNVDRRSFAFSVRCLKDTSVTLAALSTRTITDITPTSAQGGGEITDDGGAAITARGVVWGTSENPTVETNDGFTEDGSGTGAFDSDLTGLSPDTQYYVRAYASNSVGTAYGDQRSFKSDVECRILSTRRISFELSNSCERIGTDCARINYLTKNLSESLIKLIDIEAEVEIMNTKKLYSFGPMLNKDQRVEAQKVLEPFNSLNHAEQDEEAVKVLWLGEKIGTPTVFLNPGEATEDYSKRPCCGYSARFGLLRAVALSNDSNGQDAQFRYRYIDEYGERINNQCKTEWDDTIQFKLPIN